jgi:hypothetical protein
MDAAEEYEGSLGSAMVQCTDLSLSCVKVRKSGGEVQRLRKNWSYFVAQVLLVVEFGRFVASIDNWTPCHPEFVRILHRVHTSDGGHDILHVVGVVLVKNPLVVNILGLTFPTITENCSHYIPTTALSPSTRERVHSWALISIRPHSAHAEDDIVLAQRQRHASHLADIDHMRPQTVRNRSPNNLISSDICVV